MKLTISTLSTLLIFLSVKKPLLGFDSAQEISTINSTSSLILAAGHECTNADDYSPVPNDCRKYLRCYEHLFEEFICSQGTLFDYVNKRCENSDIAKCYNPLLPTPDTQLANPDISCSQLEDLTGIPDDCTKYIKCENGQLVTPNCFGGLNFDFITENCINPSDAICYPVLKADETCTDKYTMSPVIGDCTKYLRCNCGKFIEHKCPMNMNFDYKSKRCDHPENVECYPGSLVPRPTVRPSLDTTTLPQTISTCRASDGLFGLPSDCTKYKECINGQFVVKSCDKNLYFDHVNQKCSATKTNCMSSCTSKFDTDSDMTGSCISIDHCTGGVIASNNCSTGLACCVEDKQQPSSFAVNHLLTKEIFLKIAGDTTRNDAMYYYVVESLILANVETEYQIAAYLSQVLGETRFFKSFESSIVDTDVDSVLGNDRIGDGTRFRGRGGILLRGRGNYALAQKRIAGLDYNILEQPDKVSLPSIAFKIAAWFWTENAYVIVDTNEAYKSSLNRLADGTFLSFTQLTHSITTNIKSLKERAKYNEEILEQFEYVSMKRGQGVECILHSTELIGHAIPVCLIDFKRSYCGCEGVFEYQSCPYGRLKNGQCRNSAMIKCCAEQCYADLDLVILIDSSGSIGAANFKKQKRFIKALVKNFAITASQSRVALVQFNTNVKSVLTLDDETSSVIVNDAIDEMPFTGGETNTAAALKLANRYILQEENGMRPLKQGVPKVVLILTDGRSNNRNETISEAQLIKQRGFSVIAVGVGDADQEELYGISSTPDDLYSVEDFTKILEIVTDLTRTNCRQPSRINALTQIETEIHREAYKYFEHRVEDMENELTIELEDYSGRSELYFSFVDQNPKSDADFLKETDELDNRNMNFVDDLKTDKIDVCDVVTDEGHAVLNKRRFYHVTNENKSKTLFLSIKGFNEVNSIKLSIYDRKFLPNDGSRKQKELFLVYVTFITCLVNIYGI